MFFLFLILIIGPVIASKFLPSNTITNLNLPLQLLQPNNWQNNDTNNAATGTCAGWRCTAEFLLCRWPSQEGTVLSPGHVNARVRRPFRSLLAASEPFQTLEDIAFDENLYQQHHIDDAHRASNEGALILALYYPGVLTLITSYHKLLVLVSQGVAVLIDVWHDGKARSFLPRFFVQEWREQAEVHMDECRGTYMYFTFQLTWW